MTIETYFSFDTEYHWDIFVYCGQWIAECVESGVQHVGIIKEEFTDNMVKVS